MYRELIILCLQEAKLSSFEKCPYINDKKMRQEYMFALGLNDEEFNNFLNKGWRRFGIYFFKPNCEICYECNPIRIIVDDFCLSKSQKRVLKKNKDTKVIFKKLQFSNEIYKIYREHSEDRFDENTDIDDFKSTFFYNSVPSMQSEYYVNGKLAAVGFIDISNEALSSVYFVYKSDYSRLSLGTYSVIKEIEKAKSINLKYYYLGYYIKNNHSMSYKNKFKPFQLYKWKEKIWANNDE